MGRVLVHEVKTVRRRILMRMPVSLGTAVFILIGSMTQAAWASCGSAFCFLSRSSQEEMTPPRGRIVLDLSFTFINQDRLWSGTGSTGRVLLREEGEHEEVEEIDTINRIFQIDLLYGVTDRVSVGMNLPYVIRDHKHFEEPATAREVVLNPANAMGDLTLSVKYALLIPQQVGQVGLSVGGGVTLPTGEDEQLDLKGGRMDTTLQAGRGAFRGLVTGAAHLLFTHDLGLFVNGSFKTSGENDFDYQLGDEWLFNVGVRYLATDTLGLTLQFNGRYAAQDEGRVALTDVQEDACGVGQIPPCIIGKRESTGGTFYYLTPGVTVNLTEKTAIYSHAQFPVYQRVNDEQLVSAVNLLFGISTRF